MERGGAADAEKGASVSEEHEGGRHKERSGAGVATAAVSAIAVCNDALVWLARATQFCAEQRGLGR